MKKAFIYNVFNCIKDWPFDQLFFWLPIICGKNSLLEDFVLIFIPDIGILSTDLIEVDTNVEIWKFIAIFSGFS